MADVFKDYAEIYDIIYKDKDYAAECDFLESIFKKYSSRRVRSILDVACGTGNHAIPLARRGYRMYAQDASCGMLRIAEDKSLKEGLGIRFMGASPMQGFAHKVKFDAVIAMFSSIDYIRSITELKHALGNIRSCLKPGGLFIFDFWNKDCVLRIFSPCKKNIFKDADRKVARVSKTCLDLKRSQARISYTCDYYEGRRLIRRIEEVHRMKYYRVSRMLGILGSCGFNVCGCFPFMRIDKQITPDDWNISVVATPK